MADWVALLFGLALLSLVIWDRRNIAQAWRQPARWWSANEHMDSSAPSQPLNVVLGLLLGGGAVAYGVISLFS